MKKNVQEFIIKHERYRIRSKRLVDIIKACDDEIAKAKTIIHNCALIKYQANSHLMDFQNLTQDDEPTYEWSLNIKNSP